MYTFNNKSRDLVEVYFRRRPVNPFSKLSVTFRTKIQYSDQNITTKGLVLASKQEKKVVVLCSRPRQNVKLGTFTL